MSEDKKLPKGATKFNQLYDDSDEGDIDLILKQELEEAGLEYRFIDFKQAKANGGRSRSGWRVYVRQSEDPRLAGIKGLTDPDGLVRNGTMVLAVKTKGAAQKQRDRRDAQNHHMKKYTDTVTKELGADANRLGGSRVLAGYDKNS